MVCINTDGVESILLGSHVFNIAHFQFHFIDHMCCSVSYLRCWYLLVVLIVAVHVVLVVVLVSVVLVLVIVVVVVVVVVVAHVVVEMSAVLWAKQTVNRTLFTV
ncbi:hypothetical protein ElyMa_004773700 [Elysia marginata]|uniref:Transmembrane protein n=1 Tax=Elysia marginata TaxID=1093978 RepID=A0AAV4IGI9_9GAST|nr:hypothetical protein ElyMa_004773700 [Elysia marginata]